MVVKLNVVNPVTSGNAHAIGCNRPPRGLLATHLVHCVQHQPRVVLCRNSSTEVRRVSMIISEPTIIERLFINHRHSTHRPRRQHQKQQKLTGTQPRAMKSQRQHHHARRARCHYDQHPNKSFNLPSSDKSNWKQQSPKPPPSARVCVDWGVGASQPLVRLP